MQKGKPFEHWWKCMPDEDKKNVTKAGARKWFNYGVRCGQSRVMSEMSKEVILRKTVNRVLEEYPKT